MNEKKNNNFHYLNNNDRRIYFNPITHQSSNSPTSFRNNENK